MDAAISIDAFNDSLARAKLAVLQLLQDLINSLSEPDPPIPARFRELRLLAGAILRTQPMKQGRRERVGEEADSPLPPESPPPAASSSSSELAAAPPERETPARAAPRFHPSAEWARATLRSLVKDGYLPREYAVFPPHPAVDPPPRAPRDNHPP